MTVVGRERVLTELAELLASARTGAGAVAMVTGEAGIGKSTVADALVGRARSAGVPVLIGRAVADAGAPAYWPWRRALAALGLSDDLLDVGVAGGDRTAEAVAAARFHIADRVWGALATASGPDGLLLLVEDVQWLDEASAVLLRQVCREVADAGVLVLGTARSPEPDAPAAEELAGVRVIRLGPFTVADVAASMAEIAGGPVNPSWPEHVHRLTGGNPLFVRELARLLATEGRLAGPVVDVPVPAELRRVAMRRIERLGAYGQDLLGAASAIGDEIDVVLLESIVDADRRADVPSLVAEAVAAGVLVEEPERPGRVRFSHELVRRARYDELSRVERLDWHRRIADTVEAAGYSSSRPGELARHRVRAAVDEAGRRTAALACREAAHAASAQLAFGEATRWYDEAAALLDAMPDSVAPRGELLVAAADSAYRAGQFEVALDRCAEAMGVAERLGLPDLAVAAAAVVRGLGGSVAEPIVALCTRAEALLEDEDSARHALVLAQHAYALASIDRTDEATRYSHRAMPMAERSGDPDARALALHSWHEVNQGPDGVADRLAAGARLRALAGGSGRMGATMWSHVWRIEAMLEIGSVDAMDSEIVEMGALVERLGWPMARWHLLRARTARAMLAARYVEAEQHARAARQVAESTQDFLAQHLFYPVMVELMMRVGVRDDEVETIMAMRTLATVLPIGSVQLGTLSLAAGDTETAAAMLDMARPHLADYPVNSRWLATLAMGGELAARLGDTVTAALCYERVLPYEGLYLNSMTSCRGSVARSTGLMAGALGDRDAAVRHLANAVSQEQRIRSLGDAATAQVDYAQALLARGAPGDRDSALAQAEAAARAAEQFGMPPVRARAGALVQQLAGTRAADPLTGREREIAGLVAEGLSNRSIAGQLYLSERTVETHVRNLLTKLGMANRTQIAGWFMRTP